MQGKMRRCSKVFAAAFTAFGLLALPLRSNATSCTTQAEMLVADRDALASIGGRLATAIVNQDEGALQSALLPAESGDWGGMRDAVERAAPVVKGGQVQLRNLYVLDARELAAPADTQFFCSNSSGSLTVTLSMRQ